jgi:Leucine-rich repeat (LRR) protein
VARGNYGISRLPGDLEALRGLVRLDLSRNMLWQLPAWLSRLRGLTHLNVSANW